MIAVRGFGLETGHDPDRGLDELAAFGEVDLSTAAHCVYHQLHVFRVPRPA